MIKINLLGEDSASSSDNRLWLAAYAASFVLCLCIFVAMRFHIGGSIGEMEEKAAQAEAQLARLQDKTKEVRDLEAKKAELQSITLAIAALKKNQEGPVHVLDDLNTAIPEKLWLREFNCKEKLLRIDGIALTDEALVTFMRDLEKSEFFERVDLIERTTVALVQINTLNTFNGTRYRSVVRGEKEFVTARLTEIRSETEKMGLQYSYGVPDTTLTKGSDAVEATGTKLSFDSSGNKRFVGGKPTVHAWESLEQVRGESYTIEAKIRFTPKSSNIEEITASLAAASAAANQAKLPKKGKNLKEE